MAFPHWYQSLQYVLQITSRIRFYLLFRADLAVSLSTQLCTVMQECSLSLLSQADFLFLLFRADLAGYFSTQLYTLRQADFLFLLCRADLAEYFSTMLFSFRQALFFFLLFRADLAEYFSTMLDNMVGPSTVQYLLWRI